MFKALASSCTAALFLVGVGCSCELMASSITRVFVLAGQSNMAGGGAMASLPTSPFDYTQPQPDVSYDYWNNVSTSTTTRIYESADWELLRPLYPGFPGTTYGPELAFGRTLADRISGDSIAIIKVAKSGTDLMYNWDPSGPLYQNMIDQVAEAVGRLEVSGANPVMSGFVWVQGEGDAQVEAKSWYYRQNLEELFSSVRQAWNAPDLPMLYNQLHVDCNRSYVDLLRESQEIVDQGDPNAHMINIDDLALNSDSVHFTGQTHLEVGRRFADAYSRSRGDFNLDGQTTGSDLDVWKDSFGHDGLGDADGDGDTDGTDWLSWQRHAGVLPSSEAANVIPEPAALNLAILAVLASAAAVRSASRSRIGCGD